MCMHKYVHVIYSYVVYLTTSNYIPLNDRMTCEYQTGKDVEGRTDGPE
jgi:hypothetical protein